MEDSGQSQQGTRCSWATRQTSWRSVMMATPHNTLTMCRAVQVFRWMLHEPSAQKVSMLPFSRLES